MGNIGEERRYIEVLPLSEPNAPAREQPAPPAQPSEPAREPASAK